MIVKGLSVLGVEEVAESGEPVGGLGLGHPEVEEVAGPGEPVGGLALGHPELSGGLGLGHAGPGELGEREGGLGLVHPGLVGPGLHDVGVLSLRYWGGRLDLGELGR